MAHSIPGSFFISSRPVTSSPTERVYPLTYLCDLPPLPRYLETLSRAQGEPWSLHLSLTLGVAYPPAIFPVSLFFFFFFCFTLFSFPIDPHHFRVYPPPPTPFSFGHWSLPSRHATLYRHGTNYTIQFFPLSSPPRPPLHSQSFLGVVYLPSPRFNLLAFLCRLASPPYSVTSPTPTPPYGYDELFPHAKNCHKWRVHGTKSRGK